MASSAHVQRVVFVAARPSNSVTANPGHENESKTVSEYSHDDEVNTQCSVIDESPESKQRRIDTLSDVNVLSKPSSVRNADFSNTNIVNLTFGHFSMQGIRNEMEDKVTLLPHPQFNGLHGIQDGHQRSFFAVYDGHGGDVSAEYCNQHVHSNLVSEPEFFTCPSAALRNALIRTDQDFCDACRKIHLVTSSGTTALCCFLVDDYCYVANVGDSRAVLCKNQKAIPITVDHKPGRKDEKMRIESLGGRVGFTEEDAFRPKTDSNNSCWSYLCCCCKAVASSSLFASKRPLRVFPGGLSVSRTIGDISMKRTSLVISDPELFEMQLTPNDHFIILACDGVWDVLTNQQAVDVVRRYYVNCLDPEEASKALAKEAYRKGSTDNISVVCIFFQHPEQ